MLARLSRESKGAPLLSWRKRAAVVRPSNPSLVMSEVCSILPWDSDFWGFPVARIDCHTLTGQVANSAVQWCKEHKVRCLYFAADGACPETLNQAWENGFRFIDVRVDMETVVSDAPAEATNTQLCREAVAEDLAAMQDLARLAHEDTRFFKDSNFNPVKAADLYAIWIARDFRDHKVFVAVSSSQPGRVLGYLSTNKVGTSEGRIGLVAVSPEARGRGLGKHLVRQALGWFRSQGLGKVRVATQGTNVAALRLYESCGFRIADVKLWFHRWFDS